MSMNLSLRHMKAFCALASTRNFTRAAEQCSLTQSAFSALISNLETGLGVKLFSRNTRNVELTAEGDVFRNMVSHLMPETERVLSEMQDYVQRRKGRGWQSRRCRRFFPHCCPASLQARKTQSELPVYLLCLDEIIVLSH